ncbi:hypothetical protein CEUSTIGMA_g4165.t1 [Chlamydomonas eustigma]|uniref:EF-hand domain-containing protein n=1 Tax=Chlamydomonas eustigma TaxID=1157962 RepID=A0A250X1B1_9CHLO|nr:hypothetical protein CEUSTIGMA_g4165.t1 [Chlamydomonas eustigma]|eukprot:GAX76719.1 hypothetical protein CEUSTIGMA_g4165.t1 [Chlamydomonas eustigma]
MSYSPECIIHLFCQYATWDARGTSCAIIYPDFVKLMNDLELMSGLPHNLQDSYAREHVRRIDSGNDGRLSLVDFLTWFFTEVSVILPVGTHAPRQRVTDCGPIYNQFVDYTRIGPGEGSRRGATALNKRQLVRLCCDCSVLTMDPMSSSSSSSFKAASRSWRSASARSSGQWGPAVKECGTLSVANTMALSNRTLAQLETGSKLQMARFVTTLFHMSNTSGIGIDTILYRIASLGRNPPLINKEHVHEDVISKVWACYLSGEGHDLYEKYSNEVLDYHWRRWHTLDKLNMVRSVFHRYNFRLNQGMSPPRQSMDVDAETASAPVKDYDDVSFPVCCCQYKTMSLMELPTWRKLCSEVPFIAAAVNRSSSHLTPQRIETAFLTASSLGGMQPQDISIGLHDKPGGPMKKGPVSESLTPTKNMIGAPCQEVFGTPFTLGSTTAASAQRAMEFIRRPGSASPSSPTSPRYVHRPQVPTLNFIQFIEALRLVAIYIVGNTPDSEVSGSWDRPLCGLNDAGFSSSMSRGHRGRLYADDVDVDRFTSYSDEPTPMRRLDHMNHVRYCEVCTFVHSSALQCLPWKKVLTKILESIETLNIEQSLQRI